MPIYIEWDEEATRIVELLPAPRGGIAAVTETETVTRRALYSADDTPEMWERALRWVAEERPDGRAVMEREE
jgi:hypothetical protein